ncbi:hypothetical protein BBF96_03510 [Anoxybacter fermentans]|uniref:Uncharacterized protein n=1 Tax=Anoxybacter fermentans TaxID=1323375 RepID=A0A3S9SWC0_9FIRM|nr:hypothetical protein [Anoxybacter fermentans]AZR72530.1 hypothetical protein BBF96_03510 [Anoxybacter fermentans]
MNVLLKCVANKLIELTRILDVNHIKPISQINDLKNDKTWKYAITLEFDNNQPYKKRKGKYETLIFVNCYARNITNPDMAVLAFVNEVIGLLDEADFSNEDIKIYAVKYRACYPQPEKNSLLDAWQSFAAFLVRWTMK